MKRFNAVRFTSILFVIGLCFLFFSPVSIKPAAAALALGGNGQMIRLARATFDPLAGAPAVPDGLSYSAQEALDAGTYILQFSGPVLEAWKAQIAADGAALGPYVPDDAFIVHLDPAALAKVKTLEFVRWVGPYQPAYKLALGIDASAPRTYRLILFPWSQPASVSSALAALGATVRSPVAAQGTTTADGTPTDSAALLADLSGAAIGQAARLGDVLWIEPVYLQQAYNNVAGGTIMNGATAWANGYTGSGVTVAVTDTGLDTGNPSAIHQDFTGRVAHIESEPVVAANYGGCYKITNAGANDGAADVSSGHGTHVTGSAAGSGAASSGVFKGLAYQATIVFQAVEEWTTWNGGSCANGYTLSGIPDDIRPLLTTEYNWGARVQNDSWGGGAVGVYDGQAAYFDDFVHSHPDFTIVVAAGNAGVDANNDGYVDNGSVNSPATAKNLIVVGASQSERPAFGGGYAGYTWADLWPKYFDAAPTGTDVVSSSRGEMAAFSSRGPTGDGRIKPDVVAPGTDIISVRSSQIPSSSNGWGPYNSYYMYDGGTSMASPLTTGAAALVRQYYMVHENVADPSAALIKATLINTAVDIPGYGNSSYEAGAPIPNNSEGWGRVDVGAATTPGRKFVDDGAGISTAHTDTYLYNVASGKPFKVSLVWSDPMGTVAAATELVNNLDLVVTAPDGVTVYSGNNFVGGWTAPGVLRDSVNNVENVYIQSPAAGSWTVQVKGYNVPSGPQPYALVVDGNFNPPAAFTKTAPANGATGLPSNPTLTWSASTGAASYAYCVDATNNAACDTSWISAGTNTSVMLSGLAYNTTFYWQVRATNAYGSTDADSSAWFSFSGPVMPPGAFQKTAPVNGAIDQPANTLLTWSASQYAASYAYCIDTIDNSACDTSWISTNSSTSVQPVHLVDKTTYYWQARAINLAGTADADSGTWFSFTAKVLAPGAFQKAGPADHATGLPPGVTLSWSASVGAENYQVCVDTTNNNSCDTSWIAAASASSNPPGLAYGTTYYWQARAVNTTATVEADSSVWWDFTTGTLPLAFSKVSPGSGAIEQPLTPTLTWDASSGAASYEVCVDTINDNACNGTWLPAATNSLTLSSLTPATTYYWQVRAVNSAGSLEASDPWWQFTTKLYRFYLSLIRK